MGINLEHGFILIAVILISVLLLTLALVKQSRTRGFAYSEELNKKRAIQEKKQAEKALQDKLRSLLPDHITIIEPEYFFKSLMMGFDHWAILTSERQSNKARVYFCTPKKENYLERNQYGRNGLVEIIDTISFTNREQARKELSYNLFHARDIEKENERHLAGEGTMFPPPIPPTNYHPKAQADGFFYSDGANWRKKPRDQVKN